MELTKKEKKKLIQLVLEYMKQEDVDPESIGYEYEEDLEERYDLLKQFVIEYKPKSKTRSKYICEACSYETLNEKDLTKHKITEEHFNNVKAKYPQAYKAESDRILPSMNHLFIKIINL